MEHQLDRLGKGIDRNENLMPYFIECVKVYATLGEICDVLREKYGLYKEVVTF